MATAEKPVTLSIEGGIATVTLNRPKKYILIVRRVSPT